jgi:hypothetical protein
MRLWTALCALVVTAHGGCREQSGDEAPASAPPPSASVASARLDGSAVAYASAPVLEDADVAAALRAFSAKCKLDLLFGTIADCEAEKISFERSLAARSDASALRTLNAALEGSDESLRIVAANLLEDRVRGYFDALAGAKSLDRADALRLIAAVEKLPAALSIKAVRAAAYAAALTGTLDELSVALDRHPHPATRRIGYGQLVVYGGRAALEKAVAFAEREKNPEHADRMAILEGIRSARPFGDEDRAAICAWLVASLDHEAPWVAGMAAGGIGLRCGGTWTDTLLASVERSIVAGALRFEVARDLREVCGASPADPSQSSKRQCDSAVKLMIRCAEDVQLSDDARAICLDHVVRIRHDAGALALARKLAGHKSDKIRRRAEESVYLLMAEPYNLE